MDTKLVHIAAQKNTFLRQVVFWSWIALAIVTCYQYVFWGSIVDMVAVGYVLIAWAMVSAVFLRINMLTNYPLSTFLIIGFTATQFYFPLIFTSLEGKPLVFNLDLPFQVFFHSITALVVLIVAHAIYRSLVKRPGFEDDSLLIKTGFFEPPTALQIWIMGLIGLAATFYVWLYAPSITQGVSGAASDKIIQGLIPFSYAPFFIPFGRVYGGKEPPMKTVIIPLIIFSLLLFIVSLGRNSRGGFMMGFSSLGLAYGMGLMLGIFKTRFFNLRNAILVILVSWAFTGPIADIGTAMVLVRDQRKDVSYKELINQTFTAFSDKQAIKSYRLNDLTTKTDWDETYLDNVIMARFSNLKFNDISLVQAAKIGRVDPIMFSFSMDYVMATLPQPILDFLGLNVDKSMLKSVSIGDYLYYRAGGPLVVLGGFRTGHFAGTGMAAFGWWYLLILGIGIIPVFWLFDKFFIHKKLPLRSVNLVPLRQLRFSLCGMLALDAAFRFLPSESVLSTVVFLMRDWIQLVILYLLIYHLTRLIAFLLVWFKPADSTTGAVMLHQK